VKAVDQIINSLSMEPEKWVQCDFTMKHRENGVSIWTSNLPIFDTGIRRPERRIGFYDKIRLYLAVRKWHRSSPVIFQVEPPKE
jgi:hypothetical protein